MNIEELEAGEKIISVSAYGFEILKHALSYMQAHHDELEDSIVHHSEEDAKNMYKRLCDLGENLHVDMDVSFELDYQAYRKFYNMVSYADTLLDEELFDAGDIINGFAMDEPAADILSDMRHLMHGFFITEDYSDVMGKK